ncbi:MAG: alpha/beta hydrolase [Bacteroidales bacterium]|nr:alpha/beta hydrolase [Bacteroidales bacterium]
MPVLFIQGEKDMFGTLQPGREIEKRVSGRFESFIIEGGGHTPHFQNQDRIISATNSFFQ